MTTLENLFSPRSIAIVGASADPQRIGGRPLAHMIRQGFEGAVYPVNARRETVQGLPCYPSLLDIPEDLDFVLVAVPARDVPEVIGQAIAKRANTAVVLSSGFAEASLEGAAMQARIADMARGTDLRIVGPNCLGLFNSAKRFYPTFTSTIDRATPEPGGIAIASQSGAYGSHIYMVSHLRGLGIGYWITTGNECDVHVAEIIAMMAADESIHTIMAYVESVKDGDLFVHALETARQNRKPVIVMKVGGSAAGAEAARTHTASLSGEDAVYDAIFRQYGAYRARTTEEMLDVAYACRPRIYPAGKRVGIVTISGGAGILISDAASAAGLEVAPMPAEAQAHLKSLLPFASARNPVDVTAQFFNDQTLIPRFTGVMLDEGHYDGLIGFWTSVAGSPVLGLPLLAHLKETMARYPGRLFIHAILASEDIRRRYEDAGFPCFEDPSRAVAAMAALMHFGAEFARPEKAPPPLEQAAAPGSGPLSEREAKRILSAAGLPVIEDILVTTPEEAREAARKLNATLACKIASPSILHKTEIGGVILGLEGAEAAGDAFALLMERAAKAAPDAKIEGVLISPMIEGGIECILGAKNDPVFGSVVLFGLGGVQAEILKDFAIRRAPFGEDTARSMISELKCGSLFHGFRGAAPADVETLAKTIARFSVFAASNSRQIESVEMNPVIALPGGCLALDALIVPKK
jgi:acyl-CoA synthetase (NDP forming)